MRPPLAFTAVICTALVIAVAVRAARLAGEVIASVGHLHATGRA